jgi:hypothetical protein
VTYGEIVEGGPGVVFIGRGCVAGSGVIGSVILGCLVS